MQPSAVHTRAIVVGASMVGMAVARALSEHFREVIVIERDTLNMHQPEHRRGVQQSVHIHNLLLRGQHELEELFPGFVEEAIRLGATRIDHGRDVARCTNVGFCPLFETGYVSLSATRALFELAQRRRFRALTENVVLLENTRVEALIVEGEGAACCAVGVRTDHAVYPELRGELVVDCSGRSMLWKRWFTDANLALPEETVVDSRCGYASRFYKPKHPVVDDCKAMLVDPLYPERPQWAVIVPVENGEWLITLGGFNEQYPPGDEAGFERFGGRLQTPVFSAWLKTATPTSPVRTFRRLEKRWNHFERVKQPLGHFLAVGDACWAFNPLYGQGISVGVTCARILRDVLREDPSLENLARRYYPKAKRFAFPAWSSTALLDLAWPKTIGKRPWYTQLFRFAGHTLQHAAQFDDAVFLAFLRSAHLLQAPHQLARPRVLFGLVRYLFQRVTGTLPAADLTRLPPPRSPASAASETTQTA